MKKSVNEEKYCIIIPAYNAGLSLMRLIQIIRKNHPKLQIIIIDDGSKDDSFRGISKYDYISCYRHEINKGKGAAIKTGIRYAKETGFNYGIFIDADLQHDPDKISEFISAREQHDFNMVLGRRSFIKTGMPFHRILSNSITSFMISLRTGRRIHDSQCGYRLVQLSNLKIENFNDDGFQFESEFLIKMIGVGASYCEIPIPTIYNNTGSSINNALDTLKFIKIFLISYLWF